MTLWNVRTAGLVGAVLAVSACASDQTIDHGFDNHPLATLQAEKWISPANCKYWIIDDGIEGYLVPALNRDGTPVCS